MTWTESIVNSILFTVLAISIALNVLVLRRQARVVDALTAYYERPVIK